MNSRRLILILATALTLFAQPDVTLQRAMRKETLEGDLKGAIALYEKAVTEAKSDRATAAKALIRLAECYQKLGKAESRKIYERVLREYADQKEAVSMARAHLGRNKSPVEAKGDRPVWTGPEVDIFGRISPDGRYLTYVDWFETGNLMVHDMVTGTDHSLTKKKSWDDVPGQASWSSISRNGKQVVYEWWDNSPRRNTLLLADFHGSSISEPRRLLGSDEIRSVRPFDWSPDGKWIAVHVERTDRVSQIGLVALQDGSLRVLRSVDWRGPANMCFSSDSKFLIYDLPQSDATSNRDVFALAIDGSRGSSLVVNIADDRLAGISSDGQLLFASDRTGSKALWAQPFADGKTHGSPVNVKADFGSPWIQGMTGAGALYVTKGVSDSDVHFAPVDLTVGKLLADPVGVQRFPSRGRPDWSADGEFLAYVDCSAFGGGPCAISIRNMETGHVRELRPALHYLGFPRWSPDGRSFVTNGTDLKGRRGVYLIDVDSGRTTLVIEGLNQGTGQVAGWSADGKKIFHSQARKLVELDLATKNEREVLSVPIGCKNMTVSPNNRLAACISKESVLFVVPTTGGDARELFRARAPESLVGNIVLSWTLNGTALIVTKRSTAGPEHLGGPRELWLVPVSGSGARKLEIDASSWNILNPIGVRFSPDGRQVAFMAGDSGMEVWALEGFLPTKRANR